MRATGNIAGLPSAVRASFDLHRPRGLVEARRDSVAILLGTAALASVPLLFPNAALLSTLTVMFVWMSVNMAWNLVLGYAGMLSFGQMAFFAVGGYTATILNVHLGIAPWLDTPAGGVAGGVAALLIGLAAIRLRGVYVALVTLAFHELLRSLVSTDYSGLTGGPNGLSAAPYINVPNLLVQARFGYGAGLAMTGAIAILVILVLNSPIGLGLVASRDAEHVATARGVHRTKYQMIAFVLSGAVAGLMGGFYAHYIGVVAPTLFNFGIVISLLSMIIVGGWGTFWGPILGTIVMTIITSYVQDRFPRYQSLFIAVILVAIVLVLRQGLVGLGRDMLRRVGALSGRSGIP